MNIKITVRNKLPICGDVAIVCNNSDYTVIWELGEEWSVYDTKTMRTTFPDGTYEDTVFTGTKVGLPVVTVPGRVCIGLYAGDIHTSAPACITAKPSILSCGGAPAAPSEDVYNQLMERMAQLETPDWAQNDESAKDYVKNRPGGYDTESEEEISVDVTRDVWDSGKYKSGSIDDAVAGFNFNWVKISPNPITFEEFQKATYTRGVPEIIEDLGGIYVAGYASMDMNDRNKVTNIWSFVITEPRDCGRLGNFSDEGDLGVYLVIADAVSGHSFFGQDITYARHFTTPHPFPTKYLPASTVLLDPDTSALKSPTGADITNDVRRAVKDGASVVLACITKNGTDSGGNPVYVSDKTYDELVAALYAGNIIGVIPPVFLGSNDYLPFRSMDKHACYFDARFYQPRPHVLGTGFDGGIDACEYLVRISANNDVLFIADEYTEQIPSVVIIDVTESGGALSSDITYQDIIDQYVDDNDNILCDLRVRLGAELYPLSFIYTDIKTIKFEKSSNFVLSTIQLTNDGATDTWSVTYSPTMLPAEYYFWQGNDGGLYKLVANRTVGVIDTLHNSSRLDMTIPEMTPPLLVVPGAQNRADVTFSIFDSSGRTFIGNINLQYESLTCLVQAGGPPAVTADDNGKVMKVVNGAWAAGEDWIIPSSTPNSTKQFKLTVDDSGVISATGNDVNNRFATEEYTAEKAIGMNITGATVGQIAVVSAVDSGGKPTAWTAMDVVSGTLADAAYGTLVDQT